jgi:hypothetical protein
MAKRHAGSAMRAYFFEDSRTGKKRNTPVFATSASAAKDKLTRPSPEHARVYASRKPYPGEGKGGRWSRKGPTGKIKEHGKGFYGS